MDEYTSILISHDLVRNHGKTVTRHACPTRTSKARNENEEYRRDHPRTDTEESHVDTQTGFRNRQGQDKFLHRVGPGRGPRQLKLLVDTYAWIEFFLGSPKGAKVGQLLEEAEEVYTPTIVLAELSRKYLRDKMLEKDVRHRLGVIQATSDTLDISVDTALAGAKAYFEMADTARRKRRSSPGLSDGLVLGATRLAGAKVVTGDLHFQDLPETIWI